MGLLSYLAAVLAFGVLAVLLAVSWRDRSQGVHFIVATLLTAGWAALLAVQAHWGGMPFIAVYVAELLRNGAWLLVALGICASAFPRILRVAIITIWSLFLAAGMLLPAVANPAALEEAYPMLLAHGGLVLALCGLILIEQAHRNASPAGRRNLQYLLFGMGGLFVYDLFLYSQAELLHGIGENVWNARGLVNALMVPLIAVAVRRNPQWSFDLFISRHVVFYTGSIVAAGVYLLAMAAGGFYLRQIGGHWGGVAQGIFFAGAVIVLLSLLLSGSLRARFKVFLSKHFYRNKYDYRVEWLRFIQTLSSTEGIGIRATAVRAVAQIIESPGGVFYMAEEAGRPYLAVAAWPPGLSAAPPAAPFFADHELIRFLGERHWIIDLHEYRQAPDVYRYIDLPAWMLAETRWRFISPVLELDRLWGFLLLQDPTTPFQLTYEDRDLLKTVGRHVATQIAQHLADQKLAESRQFEAYNKLTAFVMHDLKNSVAQLKLLVENAARHRHNPDFIDDAIGTIANTVERITRLIEQLRDRDIVDERREVDLNPLVDGACARCAARKPQPHFNGESAPVWVQADPEKLSAVVEHLVRNAQDATAEDGQVVVRVAGNGATALLTVTDSGSGMEPLFVRDRLFRPFDSTKGSKGMGVGAYQAREYIRQLGGEVEVQSMPGRGTTFSVKLPRLPDPTRNQCAEKSSSS